jgi:hypothetical protein
MKQPLNEQFIRMQKLAGVITENQINKDPNSLDRMLKLLKLVLDDSYKMLADKSEDKDFIISHLQDTIKGVLNVLKDSNRTNENQINEEKTWDDVDKELADEEAQDIKKAKTFVNTIQGKNAVRVIKALINKPYGYDKLDKVLQVLNLDRQNFIYAAKAAGMDFETDAAGIHIYDDNYQDQDVAINQINGDWIVG